jgi:biotin carboxyl carrier protein
MATYKVKACGKEHTVEVLEQDFGARVLVDGYSFDVEPAAPASVPGRSASRTVAPRPAAPPPTATPTNAKPESPKAATAAAPASAPKAASGRGAVLAPIPGVITQVCVAVGDAVQTGDTVAKLEAMKMENDITALISGTVREVAVEEGAEVSDGQLLVLVG